VGSATFALSIGDPALVLLGGRREEQALAVGLRKSCTRHPVASLLSEPSLSGCLTGRCFRSTTGNPAAVRDALARSHWRPLGSAFGHAMPPHRFSPGSCLFMRVPLLVGQTRHSPEANNPMLPCKRARATQPSRAQPQLKSAPSWTTVPRQRTRRRAAAVPPSTAIQRADSDGWRKAGEMRAAEAMWAQLTNPAGQRAGGAQESRRRRGCPTRQLTDSPAARGRRDPLPRTFHLPS
jgi:hypothetical protein